MVGGVTSYGYPTQPSGFDSYVNREEDIDLHRFPQVQPKPTLPPPFMHDKFISKTNQELNPLVGGSPSVPVLPQPEPLEIDAIKEFIHKVEMLGARFEKLEFEAQKMQRELVDEGSEISTLMLHQLQKEQKALLKEYNEAWEKFYDRSKGSKIVSWIDNMFTMSFLAVTVISVGLAVITAGASMAFSAAAVGLFGIGKGVSSITNGVFKYELNKDQALIGEVQWKREMTKEQITEIIRNSKSLNQLMLSTCKLTRDFLENYQAAASANFNK